MHKGIILLVKAPDKQEAESEAEHFLDSCAESCEAGIDWGKIGGRWKDIISENAQPYRKVRKLVKEWESGHLDRLIELKKAFKKECRRQSVRSLQGLLDGDLFMLSYYLEAIDSLKRKRFSTNVNIFDKEEWVASTENADKKPEEYYAVMIDVHH